MKWGFLSYGTIAPKFFESFATISDEELVAIATRYGVDRALKEHPGIKIYHRYEDLYNDPEVEIVYLSSTHNYHFDQGMQVLKSGKHLLCEKPLTTSFRQTKELIEQARSSKVFLMEAIWTRCMPAYIRVLKHIRDGDIGEVKYIQANFSFFNDWAEERRLFNKRLAGGAIYDVGIYNLSLIFDVMGSYPLEIKALAELTHTGVDQSCAAILSFEGGKLASLHSGFRLDTDHQAKIYGTKGWIEMDLHWKPRKFRMNRKGKGTEEVFLPFQSNGYAHEIVEAVHCVEEGKLESDLISHETSLQLAKSIDEILTQIGYK
jgi:predicted dehydrogenase